MYAGIVAERDSSSEKEHQILRQKEGLAYFRHVKVLILYADGV